VFRPAEAEYLPGRSFVGGTPASPITGTANVPGIRRGPINSWTEALGNGAVIAIDPLTGGQRWRFPTTDVSSSGILTTATDLLFTGSREGYFYALDARTGALLWRASLGGQGANGPIAYAVGDVQYVAVASGNGLFVFALRD
jgi:alcohol dehydrogenase (cytochrome c)